MLKFVALFSTGQDVAAMTIDANSWPDAIAKAMDIQRTSGMHLLQLSRGA